MRWSSLLPVIVWGGIFFLSRKAVANTGPNHDKLVVCYVGTWAVYRPDKGSFSIDNIDPKLCTHLVYAFAGLDETKSTIKSLDEWQDLTINYGKGGFQRMTNFKNFYPHLKVLLAIGGWNEGSSKYSAMVKIPSKRNAFITSAIDFLKKYKFDGLDLDWEFPGKRGGDEKEDKNNFLIFVKELKSAFKKHNLLLTAAIGAGKDTIDIAYDIENLSYYLDFIHVMCYDYHGAWDGITGANAPLKSKSDYYSVEFTIKYLLELRAAREKVILGVPLYGRTFLTVDSSPANSTHHELAKLGAISNGSFPGQFTKENGFMGYNEICVEIQNETSNWKTHWDEETHTPFAVDSNKVISFDNERSIVEKVRFAMEEGLGGIMVWSLDTDDFLGECSFQKFPLMRTINKAIEITLKEIEENKLNEISADKNGNGNNHASSSVFIQNYFFLLCNYILYYILQ